MNNVRIDISWNVAWLIPIFAALIGCGSHKPAVKVEESTTEKFSIVKEPGVLSVQPGMPEFVKSWLSSGNYSPPDWQYFYFLAITPLDKNPSREKELKMEIRKMGNFPSYINLDNNRIETINSEDFKGRTYTLVRYPFETIDSLRNEVFKENLTELTLSYFKTAEYFAEKSASISLKYSLIAYYYAHKGNSPDSVLLSIRSQIRNAAEKCELNVELISRNFNRYSFRVTGNELPDGKNIYNFPLILYPHNNFYATREGLLSTGENCTCEFWVNILPDAQIRPLSVSVDMFRYIPSDVDSSLFYREFRDIIPKKELPIEIEEPPILTRKDIAGVLPETSKGEIPDLENWEEKTVSVIPVSETDTANVEPEEVESRDTTAVIPQKQALKDTITSAAVIVKKPKPKPAEKTQEDSVVVASEIKGSIKEKKETQPQPVIQKRQGVSLDLGFMSIIIDDIFFDANRFVEPSKTLNRNYIVTLSKVVKILKNEPDIIIRVEGHTDNSGEEDYNRWISMRRAITVGQLLVELFPKEKQSEIMNRIEVAGRGGEHPLIEGETKIRSVLNRRVSIQIDDHFTDGIPLSEAIETVPIRYIPPEQQKKALITAATSREQNTDKASVRKTSEKSIIPAKITEPPEPGSSKPVFEEKRIYSAGYTALQKKEYKTARTYFESIIKQAPKSTLADNAQYWIGEILYSQKKYSEAVVAFSEVERYGDGNKIPYATLMMGYCYWRLGNKEKALDKFAEVLEKYPKAYEEKKKAQNMINRLTAE